MSAQDETVFSRFISETHVDEDFFSPSKDSSPIEKGSLIEDIEDLSEVEIITLKPQEDVLSRSHSSLDSMVFVVESDDVIMEGVDLKIDSPPGSSPINNNGNEELITEIRRELESNNMTDFQFLENCQYIIEEVSASSSDENLSLEEGSPRMTASVSESSSKMDLSIDSVECPNDDGVDQELHGQTSVTLETKADMNFMNNLQSEEPCDFSTKEAETVLQEVNMSHNIVDTVESPKRAFNRLWSVQENSSNPSKISEFCDEFLQRIVREYVSKEVIMVLEEISIYINPQSRRFDLFLNSIIASAMCVSCHFIYGLIF